MTSRTHKRTLLGQEVEFPDGGLWTHCKSGGQYVVMFPAMIEATATPGVAYCGHDGLIWVRPVEEFLDGRFV